ncbi:MAG TPA: tetratricopeptide repeat protein [Blastocatellia bacterium]|nr:tetratricopeptide repeat protein [Blastocatellia bacterium]
MNTRTFLRLNSVLALLLFVAVSAQASDKTNGKQFSWTTRSKEAKDFAAQVVRGIESFQGGPPLLTLAQKAVEADPDFAFGHYMLATFTPPPNNKQHQDKATELAAKASDGERRYIEAVFLVRAQQADKALPILLDLARQYPEERMVQMMLGQVYTNQGKYDEAKAAFDRAIQIDGSTPRAYAFLGNIYLLKGDYDKARELYNKSLAKKVEGTAPFLPYNGLAYTYVYQGDVNTALKYLNTFLTEYEKTGQTANFPPVFIWNAIGRLLLESGRPEESIKAYEKGYETVKASTVSALDDTQRKIWLGRLHHGRGRALAKMGKHEEAWKEAELIKKMIEEGGEQGKQFWPAYHYMAGYLKLEAGDYAKAIEHLKQADQANDPFQQLLLARAYEKAGDQENAQKVYKQVTASTQFSIERALAYPEARKKLKS